MNRLKLGIAYDGSSAADVREIVTSLSDDYELVFITPRAADPITQVLKSFGQVIPADIPGGISRAAELSKNYGIDGLVTYSEQMLRLTAELSERLNLRGHDVPTAMRLTNKKYQRESLSAAGLPVPRNAVLSRAEDWPDVVALVGLPAIVKPLRGSGSAMTYPVVSEEDVSRLQRSLFSSGQKLADGTDDGYIVEQLMIGRESAPFGDYVSVECRTVAGHTSLYAITGTFPLAAPFREPGQFWPCHLPASEQAEIFELARAAVAAMGITDGISHTEVKLTDIGPRIIEVNGRIGGLRADLSLRHGGLDLIREAADIALGVAEKEFRGFPRRRPGATYSYSALPPSDARHLVSISGYGSLLSMRGVDGYRRYYKNGSRLAADGSTDRLDVLFGHAPSLQDIIPSLQGQLAPLAYTFRGEADYVVRALDLPAASFIEMSNAASSKQECGSGHP